MPDNTNDDLGRELERLDKLLDRGIAQISGMEIEEIVRGVSIEDLEAQGGEHKLVEIKRSEYSQARKVGDLQFEEHIRFAVENGDRDPAAIDPEELAQFPDVEPETLVAVSALDENRPALMERRLLELGPDYQEAAGVGVTSDGSRISIRAKRRGKVLLLKNKIYIIPSDRDGSCTVRISDDFMTAYIDCQPALGRGSRLTVSMVFEELGRRQVVRGIDGKAIESAVEAANTARSTQKDIVAARGRAPQHGKDSTVTFHIATDTPEIGFRILPDGRIDYRKQAPIKMAEAGDLVATVNDPVPGIDGFRVDGVPLPALQGCAEMVIEGDNVRKDENRNRFYAECGGVVSYHDKILSVYPHYQVDGDVDMRSGNVTFNGSVTVCGNVKSGFEVKATGDITVLGSVEAADIDAGRDVRINGAAVGGNGTVIKSGRNMFVGHVQNARLEAQGDVEIVRSAMHSAVYSTGKVRLHDGDGSIVGGEMNAMRGVEAMSIGSAMGSHTEVVAGSDYLVKRKKTEVQDIIRFYEANLAKIDMVLKPLTDIIKKGIHLGAEKKQRLGTIVDKRKDVLRQLRMLRQRHRSLSETDPAAASVVIIIKRTLHQDVTLKIGDLSMRTNEDLCGVTCKLSTDLRKIEMRSSGGGHVKATAGRPERNR